jgi:hypothetical protein
MDLWQRPAPPIPVRGRNDGSSTLAGWDETCSLAWAGWSDGCRPGHRAWPQILDFFGTPLVLSPSVGQLSSDAGRSYLEVIFRRGGHIYNSPPRGELHLILKRAP